MDNHGNACGIAGGHTPCGMEMNSLTPEWKKCKRNNSENGAILEFALDNCQIFPSELCPPAVQSWKGIRLRTWYDLFSRE